MKYKTMLKSAAAFSVLAGGIGAPAIAQDDEGGLEQIIVTAQRVEQNLQDVPVAVTALSTENLEQKQVQNIRDLTAQIPNINIATNTGTANAARIFLRGVGEDESRGAVDQAVGIYVDGVYVGRSVGSLFDVVDLASLEVLRGPQGTLYGRNTIGGAIKLNSVRPQMENGGDLRLTVGNEGRLDIRGTGNLALGENTAVRLTAMQRQRDGFHTLNPNGALAGTGGNVGKLDTTAVRASLSHDFNADWNLFLAFDYTDDASDPIPDSAAPPNDADNDLFTIEPLPGTTCTATSTALGCYTGYDQSLETMGLSATVEGVIKGLDFTSITGYRQMEDELATRIGLVFNQMTDQDQFSQEFTLGSSGNETFDWLAGVYYFTEDIQLDTVFAFPFQVKSETESFALFGQGTMKINDRLNITGGLRFTDESKDFEGANLAPFPPFNGFTRTDTADFENLSGTIGADFRFNEDVMGYAKYSSGFKSGGWSPDAFSGTAVFLPVDEETLDSFEAGIKSDLSSNLRLNLAAFFNQYQGLQIGATVPGLGFTRFNVDETQIRGIEAELVWQVTPALQINGNAGLLDAEYTEVTGDQARGLTNNLTNPVAGCAGVNPAVDSQIIPCALGLSLKNAPEYKVTVGALYNREFWNGSITASGDISFEDDAWSLVANAPAHALAEIPTLANARIKYEDASGWSVALWGRNLGDEEYYRAASASSFTAYASEPLTYGLDLGYTF